MTHKIDEIYRDLKHKETLQASLEIQNLKLPPKSCFYSPLQPYQPSKINLPGNIKVFCNTYKASNLSCHKCGISMIFDLIQTEAVSRWYTPISSSWVTGCERPILIQEHHSGAQHSSSPKMMGSVSPPPVMVYQITHYVQDIRYKIPTD